ncbi:hypothetical protein T8K17_05230 [Thalassobaculum sp. OXR-137]|uniref:hypothetical protein n=1 Tax=Thalassobaculum sp. OXR-137 TaxID=3100173 RepID=UPI002AC8ACF8|nr:hypothetical protein [Thalassobaculum sp. OXR-137]WPZ35547.1 hypothetical protein T8K17_05230 [Thalassobaculum sp. OXR-137]
MKTRIALVDRNRRQKSAARIGLRPDAPQDRQAGRPLGTGNRKAGTGLIGATLWAVRKSANENRSLQLPAGS